MANVVRFTLSTARELDVPGAGSFHLGVLDVDANNLALLARTRYLVQPYGVTEVGIVDSATAYPSLPAVPVSPPADPYPQYPTMDEIIASAAFVPSGDLSAFGIYLPEKYGAVGNGATNDTAAVQAAIDACPAGKKLYLSRPYFVPGGVTVTRQIKIEGTGGLNFAGTTASGLLTNSPTVTPLTITASGCTLRDFAVVNTTTATAIPTAGAGILFTGTGAADFAHVENVTSSGFYNGMQVDSGFYFTVTNCRIFDAVNYGLYMRSDLGERFDHGDQSILGCTISAAYVSGRNGVSAVRWESGGGLRFIDNKINAAEQPTNFVLGKWVTGLDCAVLDGGSTSVLVVTGNSLENCTSACVKVSQAGPANTGRYRKIVITGNEFFAGGADGVLLSPAVTGQQVGMVMIGDNVFDNLRYSVNLKNVDGVTIGTNYHEAASGIFIDTGCTNITLTEQGVLGDNMFILQDASYPTSGTIGGSGLSRLQLNRDIPATTSNVTYTALWSTQHFSFSAGVMTLTLSGDVVGVGAFMVQAKRTFSRGNGGVVTVATVGTDIVVGAAVDVLFDTATTGQVRVKVKLNAGGGTAIYGRASLVAEGPLQFARKGI